MNSVELSFLVLAKWSKIIYNAQHKMCCETGSYDVCCSAFVMLQRPWTILWLSVCHTALQGMRSTVTFQLVRTLFYIILTVSQWSGSINFLSKYLLPGWLWPYRQTVQISFIHVVPLLRSKHLMCVSSVWQVRLYKIQQHVLPEWHFCYTESYVAKRGSHTGLKFETCYEMDFYF